LNLLSLHGKEPGMNIKNKKAMHVAITPEQLVGEITKRAHEIYLKRGSMPGTPLEDWLKAEKDVKLAHGIA